MSSFLCMNANNNGCQWIVYPAAVIIVVIVFQEYAPLLAVLSFFLFIKAMHWPMRAWPQTIYATNLRCIIHVFAEEAKRSKI